MFVSQKKKEIITKIKEAKSLGKTIGFVPTMGALHQGHLALLKQAQQENDQVVLSIFVNPTQFNNPEDLEKYPRTIEKDLQLASTIDQQLIVYTPTVQDLYENTVKAQKYTFDGLEHEMEGANRPGHFDGVGTVVQKLFEITQPHRAYFGEKDFQQLQIIKNLVQQLQFPIQIIGCPIYRQDDGLAMSSRNERLNTQQKKEATLIYKILCQVKKRFKTNTLQELQQYVQQVFNQNPHFELEYFVFADEHTLKTLQQKQPSTHIRAFIVVHIGGVRLIDNMSMTT